MDALKQNRILAGLTTAQTECFEVLEALGYWEKNRTIMELASVIMEESARVKYTQDLPSARLVDFSLHEEQLAKVILWALATGAKFNLSVSAAVIAQLEHQQKVSKLIKNEKV